ncbi:MAG: riboflavin synthase [Leptospirales bacterium]|jgi:riboflavin synthase
MFTGIIETVAVVNAIEDRGGNRVFQLETDIAGEFRPEESVAHNGVCLTVENASDQAYQVTAIPESLQRSMLGDLSVGDRVNLERALPAGGRLDGHFVQGHVDATGEITRVIEPAAGTAVTDSSWEFVVRYGPQYEALIVEKGSICVNGISLTVASNDPTQHSFSVCIIPYTWEHTNVKQWKTGTIVNLEFDVLGKYVQKILALRPDR